MFRDHPRDDIWKICHEIKPSSIIQSWGRYLSAPVWEFWSTTRCVVCLKAIWLCPRKHKRGNLLQACRDPTWGALTALFEGGPNPYFTIQVLFSTPKFGNFPVSGKWTIFQCDIWCDKPIVSQKKNWQSRSVGQADAFTYGVKILNIANKDCWRYFNVCPLMTKSWFITVNCPSNIYASN